MEVIWLVEAIIFGRVEVGSMIYGQGDASHAHVTESYKLGFSDACQIVDHFFRMLEVGADNSGGGSWKARRVSCGM